MSDLGVRTAARKEAEQYLCGDEFCEGCLERRIGFEDGAVWAAGRLPTRDEIAEMLYETCWGDMLSWEDDKEMFYDYADAVLALIQSRMEE